MNRLDDGEARQFAGSSRTPTGIERRREYLRIRQQQRRQLAKDHRAEINAEAARIRVEDPSCTRVSAQARASGRIICRTKLPPTDPASASAPA